MDFMAVDSIGLSGGLLCNWDPKVFQLQACCSSRRFIMFLGTLFKSFDCVILNLYAPDSVGDRKKLWDSLIKLKMNFQNPWCLCGDFNEIKNISERKGCYRRDRGMKDLNDFIDKCELNDMPLRGRKFMWCNSAEAKKWSRIYRVFVDPKWIERFNLKLWRLPRCISDLCPLLLMGNERDWGPKPFRFLNAWALHSNFTAFIEKTWKEIVVEGCASFTLQIKLKTLKLAIKI
ncbi:uncharacterized protein LOC114285783 [Camellia sinensis]|uniref:uncharacterized protein LOC114285783 n=1 Tax=Camellia sinensis TaxID=4442 RepID=UPI0010362806|nr:uncharacterized protein LOC114285783 [Camellia sinensis]